MYSLCSLGKQLHDYEKVIGDIRPLNVFISGHGQIKIMTKVSLPFENTNINKTLNMSTPTFIAPEQYEKMKEHSIEHIRIS